MKKVTLAALILVVIATSCTKTDSQLIETKEEPIYFRVEAKGVTTDYSRVVAVKM